MMRANKKPTDLGVLGLDACKQALNQLYGEPSKLSNPKKDDPNAAKKFGHETPQEIKDKAEAAAAARARVADNTAMFKHLAIQALKSFLLQRLVAKLVSLVSGGNHVDKLAWLVVASVNIYRYGAPRKLNPQLSSRGMRWLPVLGHSIDMLLNKSRNHDFLLETFTMNNNQSMEIQVPGGNFVAPMDARDREYVLKTNFLNYPKNREGDNGSFEYVFGELMGRGIFATDGVEWRDTRKVASHMFSGSSLKEKMEQVFNKHADHFITYLDTACASGKPIDVQQGFQSVIFDGFCEIAFGVTPGTLDMLMSGGQKSEFLLAFDRAQCHSTERFLMLPIMWTVERYFSLLTGIGSGAQYAKDIQTLIDFVDPIVHNRLNDPDVDSKTDLLSLYINHAKSTGQDFMLQIEYLRDMIQNYLIAGRDTSSATLGYTLKYLGQNPEVMARFREEGMLSDASFITLDDTKTKPFADAVVNEALRLAPPVVTEIRMCVGDDVLPSGIKMKDGFRVIVPNRVIGRDEFLWSEPNKFNPERWMQYDAEGKALPVRRPDEFVFPVFWSGKRLCLGKDMARFEVIVFMNKIFSKFNIRTVPGQSEDVVPGPVMFAKEGIMCMVEKRA